MTFSPYRVQAPYDWASLLTLIQAEFAYMQGRIDPPSSMHRLGENAIAEQTVMGEIWAVGIPPIACVFLTPKGSALYVGKLAVDQSHRGKGFARTLMAQAEARAGALGFKALELEVRVELIENQQIFRRLGFEQTATSAHPGYSRATSVTFRKSL